MAVLAHATVETDPSEFDAVLDAFDEGDPLVVYEVGPSAGSEECQTVGIRTSEVDTLARFYEACAGRGIVLDVRGIRHEPEIESTGLEIDTE